MMVDNLGKNMMLDTWDGQIWYPRFYDMDTICSYNNSGEIKFDVDIEMEQGYWNTSSSRLWTKVRDLMHDELVEIYKDMRQNGMTFDSFMECFYGDQISKIPQKYYNKDYDVKYAPYSDQYIGKAHGDGYQHLKRWLKNRLIFTDTLFDYAPSYENDVLTIRANTLDKIDITIETYTPVYQHLSWYNGQMSKEKIVPGQSFTFSGNVQASTDQEILIYGGSNIKKITGISSANPNELIIGNAPRLTELVATNCPLLTTINSNKANLSAHTYLNKLDLSGCSQLGGILQLHNSQLIQDINMKGTAITGLQMPKSLRNLKVLRLPNTTTELVLNDAPLLHTIELDEGNALQSISLLNCNKLDNCINFDLTKVPTISLDNSYNTEELYMSATTNLTLKNIPSLKRVIFTPNSEYSAFDINNVLNGANYKITTFNNPMMTDFITTAPHRLSYNNGEYKQFIEESEKVYTVSDMTENHAVNWQTGADLDNNSFCRLPYTEVYAGDTIKIESTHISGNDSSCWVILYDDNKAYRGAFSSNGCNGAYNTTNGEVVVLENGYMRIRMGDGDTDGKIYYTRQSKTIMTKDITPNTAFTANTLDLADTQFQNVKFLCTTDVYNLKVPTSMKNFYCDSAMDIDTDVIEDASYETIHEELIEPYTTNYEGNVYRYESGDFYNVPVTEWVEGYKLHGVSGALTADANYKSSADFIEVVPGSKLLGAKNARQVFQYAEDKTTLTYQGTNFTTGLQSNTKYIKLVADIGATDVTISYTGVNRWTPNIIPSSANGSLIFNMYSNNTTQPTSTSPYMWDLTGLKLEDFYTYGMNNWVKASEDSYMKINNTQLYKVLGWRYSSTTLYAGYGASNMVSISPILIDDDVSSIIVTTSNGCGFFSFNSTDWDGTTATKQDFPGGGSGSGTTINYLPLTHKLRLFTFFSREIEWFDIQMNGDIVRTIRYYLSDMLEVNADDEIRKTIARTSYLNKLSEVKSITMPQRMPGYSVRLVNADITPDEYPTMLYPKLIDTGLPITGKLDYTKYNGTSLAWAYAYTTGDVDINPLDSRSQGNITQDYNKLYNTDFVDIVDVWVYKDTDTSKLSTNEAITKAYIELTSANYKTRIDEVLQWYPNCTDLYLFDDGSVTSLYAMFEGNNGIYKAQIEKIAFIEGYFNNLKSFVNMFSGLNTTNGVDYDLRGLANASKNTTSLSGMFQYSKVNSINFDGWDGSNIKDISKMFQYVIMSIVDLSALDLSNVENMAGAFRYTNNSIQKIKINSDFSKVTDLNDCFHNCYALNQEFDFSKSTSLINTALQNTFYNCSSLTYAPILPSNYKGSMNSTFYGCTSLTQVPVIPQGVTNMQETFRGCTSLTTPPTTIPNSVTSIKSTFYDCTSLTQAPTIPNSVTNMESTFYNCTSLTTAPTIPQGVTNMASTFFGCTVLTTAPTTIPNSVTSLASAFRDCKALTTPPAIGSGVVNMANTFRGCTSLTTAPTIPQGVTNMDSCFNGCTSLTTAPAIPEGVTNMDSCFSNCTSLTQAPNIPNSCTNYRYVVYNTLITSITLPLENVTNYTNAVGDCSSLVDITWSGERSTDFSLTSLGQGKTKYTQQDIQELVPEHLADLTASGTTATLTLGDYASYLSIGEILSAQAKGWTLEGNFSGGDYAIVNASTDLSSVEVNSDITTIIVELTNDNYKTRMNEVYTKYPSMTDILFTEDGTVTTLADMFNNSNNNKCRSKIKKIEFLEGYFQNLTNLTYSFYNCTSLTDVSNIPNSVTNMYRTFYYCYDLENVSDLPDGVTNVNYTFYRCESLATAPKLGKSTTVLDYTFYGCEYLETVPEFPPNITKLSGTFSGCSRLTSVPDIPNSVTDMSSAFYNCSRLVVAPKLPTGVQTLSSTFYGCSSLQTPPSIIPKSVVNTSSCFNGCTSLVTPPEFEHVDGSNLYPGRMYQNCSKMTTAPKIPNGVDDILGMFVGCSKLQVPPTIPDSVINMQETFNNCTGLTQNPNVPTGVTNLKYAFSNSSITAITIPLTNLTTYDYAISKCPNLTDVTWVGELTSTFNVKNLYYRSATDNTTPTATDIQELIPEHLGTVTGKTLTLGDYISYLTEDEIAQAVAKGWTIQ